MICALWMFGCGAVGFMAGMALITVPSIRALAKCLRECSDDLEAEVLARYGGQNPPTETERKRMLRDLHPVAEARAALAAWERAK